MKDYILTVTLNPAIDKTVRLKHFTPGQDHYYRHMNWSAGGKGINVSRTLLRLGEKTLATGFIGGPQGEYIKSALRQENIPFDFVDVEGESRVSVTVIDEKTRRLTRLLARGPDVPRKKIRDFKKKFQALARRSSLVVLSGRNVPGAAEDFYSQLIGIARREGKMALLDASGRPLALGLKAGPFLVKPNLEEAQDILMERLDSLPKLQKAVAHLRKKGAQCVIISLAEQGAIAGAGRETWVATPSSIKAVNTVGSGDALMAGFVAACLKRKSLGEALLWAVAAGTANVLSIQPGHLSRAQVRKMAGQIKMVRLT